MKEVIRNYDGIRSDKRKDTEGEAPRLPEEPKIERDAKRNSIMCQRHPIVTLLNKIAVLKARGL